MVVRSADDVDRKAGACRQGTAGKQQTLDAPCREAVWALRSSKRFYQSGLAPNRVMAGQLRYQLMAVIPHRVDRFESGFVMPSLVKQDLGADRSSERAFFGMTSSFPSYSLTTLGLKKPGQVIEKRAFLSAQIKSHDPPPGSSLGGCLSNSTWARKFRSGRNPAEYTYRKGTTTEAMVAASYSEAMRHAQLKIAELVRRGPLLLTGSGV